MQKNRWFWPLGLFVILLGVQIWLQKHTSEPLEIQRLQKAVWAEDAKNQTLFQENQFRKQQIQAMRYDPRVIEQVARDHLSMTRSGEIVLYLSR